MARRNHQRRGPHRAATRKQSSAPVRHPSTSNPKAQPLIAMLREALRPPGALGFPGACSTILSTLSQPEAHGGQGTSRPDDRPVPRMSLHELVDSFVGVDIAETTAALHAIAALVPDDLLAARLRRELAGRRQPVPAGTAGLDTLRAVSATVMTDPLGDGEDVVLGLEYADGTQGCFLVYVDHNLGTVVKDAFAIDEPASAVLGRLEELAEEQGLSQVFAEIEVADARARLSHAITAGDQLAPSLTSDTWPGCRPLLEMVLRRMPADGVGYDTAPYDAAELVDLTHDFLASDEASGLDDEQDHELAHVVVEFGAEYLGGDPLRWSPVTVEIALLQALPAALDLGADELARAPQAIRSMVRYAHRVSEVEPRFTEETLQAVDRWEPRFQELLEDPEAMRARRELAATMDLSSLGDWSRLALEAEVGGPDALRDVDTRPLPDEPIDWEAIAADVVDKVREVAGLVDEFATEYFDVEFRTACRRFLERAAVADPAIFRRRGRVETAAAAVAWAVGRANQLVGYAPAPVMTKDLVEWFGLSGSPSQRAQPMLAANGVDRSSLFAHFGALGTPDLLTGGYRAALVERREALGQA